MLYHILYIIYHSYAIPNACGAQALLSFSAGSRSMPSTCSVTSSSSSTCGLLMIHTQRIPIYGVSPEQSLTEFRGQYWETRALVKSGIKGAQIGQIGQRYPGWQKVVQKSCVQTLPSRLFKNFFGTSCINMYIWQIYAIQRGGGRHQNG